MVGAHLGGEVVGGAGDGGGEVVRALEDAGDAEIAEFDDAAATEEDVLRLEVAVHDAESVDVVERERDLRRPVEHLALGKVSPRLRARRMWVNRSPSSAYAVTMHRDSVSSSRKDSLYAMMFGWRSFDRSCASASASPRCAILCTGIFFATYGRRSLRCITRWHVP